MYYLLTRYSLFTKSIFIPHLHFVGLQLRHNILYLNQRNISPCWWQGKAARLKEVEKSAWLFSTLSFVWCTAVSLFLFCHRLLHSVMEKHPCSLKMLMTLLRHKLSGGDKMCSASSNSDRGKTDDLTDVPMELYIDRSAILDQLFKHISLRLCALEMHHYTERQPAVWSSSVYTKAHCLGSYLQNKGGVCDSELRRHTCPGCASAVLCLGPSPCWVLFDGY